MEIKRFQSLMLELYGARDRLRGSKATFQWFIEEIGELAHALRKGHEHEIREEIADVFAWLASLANIHEIDIDRAINEKYPGYCLHCGKNPCACKY
ncbi:MAG: MazG nucleotide pyrophosphohydrolase domain-containing protein [Candidatus Ranarchaeia archaeon]